jgi:hypothetical protein
MLESGKNLTTVRFICQRLINIKNRLVN